MNKTHRWAKAKEAGRNTGIGTGQKQGYRAKAERAKTIQEKVDGGKWGKKKILTGLIRQVGTGREENYWENSADGSGWV